MFDVKNCVKTRYFELKLYDKNNKSIVLHVEPPKIKTLKKVMKITENENLTEEEFKYIVTSLINKNKENIAADKYIDEINIDQLKAVYTAFMSWIDESKKEKN